MALTKWNQIEKWPEFLFRLKLIFNLTLPSSDYTENIVHWDKAYKFKKWRIFHGFRYPKICALFIRQSSGLIQAHGNHQARQEINSIQLSPLPPHPSPTPLYSTKQNLNETLLYFHLCILADDR
jgi:hypothetical protein